MAMIFHGGHKEGDSVREIYRDFIEKLMHARDANYYESN
jgi:hypothetical protein